MSSGCFLQPTRRSGTAKGLYPILSVVEAVIQRGHLPAVLEALDTAKPAVFSFLMQHFGSGVVAKAVTLKVLNLCLCEVSLH
jgi:hypothetical protein